MTCEFKRSSINDDKLAEAVVCLANGGGGVLLLGVEDDGTLSGLADGQGRIRTPLAVMGAVRLKIVPTVDVNASLVEIRGREVIVLEVGAAQGPIGTKAGKYLTRALRGDGTPECRALQPHEMVSRYYSLPEHDFSATVVRDATMGDLDPREFQRLRDLARRASSDAAIPDLSDDDIARALDVVRRGEDGTVEVLLGGLLLFGYPDSIRKFAPNAEVIFQETDGSQVKTNESVFLPLLAAAEFLGERLTARNTSADLDFGMQRISLPRFPSRVIREAVANALVHRDYALLGPVRCELRQDELRISSPGGLPVGITQFNIVEESQPRSRILANAFHRAGVVDRSGQGVKIMTEELLRVGRGGPDYSGTTEASVVVSIPSTEADAHVVRYMATVEARNGRPVEFRHLQLMRAIRQVGPMSSQDLAEYMKLSKERTRALVHSAVERGLVETRGVGRGQVVVLPTAFYSLTGENAEHARISIPSRIRQEQMVMEFVDAAGKASRKDVAELLRVASTQATRILKAMRDDGRLEQRGSGRGTYYVKANGESMAIASKRRPQRSVEDTKDY